MKKILGILIVLLLLTGCNEETPFYLEDEYYGSSKFIDLDENTLNSLIEDKKSFALFIYQPLCTTSSGLEEILTDYAKTNQISFYKMSFSDMKETVLGDTVKYYPSLVIYHNGEIADYLDANSDEDTSYFKNADDFDTWFQSYVRLKEVDAFNEENIKEESSNTSTEVILENVTYDENKINVYFFWGDGCPHCESEFNFFDSIENEYGDYFTLNAFEVWNNEENASKLTGLASKMGDEVTGVPYTIIGDKTFMGFNDDYKEEMLNIIKNEYKNSYDVYFDKN